MKEKKNDIKKKLPMGWKKNFLRRAREYGKSRQLSTRNENENCIKRL
jgi:hypothetical protein